MPDVELRVNGQSYAGWEQMTVTSSLDEVSGSFQMQVSDRWAEAMQAQGIEADMACSVLLEGQPIITGYVFQAGPTFDSTSHYLNVAGRDKTSDLIDCSAVVNKGEWRNATPEQIIRDVCKPYGVGVKVASDLGGPIPSFAIEPGETVFSLIERLGDQRGFRLSTDGAGNLIAGEVPATPVGVMLVEGQNMKSGSYINDTSQRFSEYVIRGQSAGSDDKNGKAASAQRASSTDAGVARHRTLVVVAEDQADVASLQRRADWERNVRAARGRKVTAQVQGWSYQKGHIWRINQLVPVRSPLLGIDETLLISECVYRIDVNGGTVTDLTLAPKDAYTRSKNEIQGDRQEFMRGKHRVRAIK